MKHLGYFDPGFEQQLIDNPLDAGLRSIYADWLNDRDFNVVAAFHRWMAKHERYPIYQEEPDKGFFFYNARLMELGMLILLNDNMIPKEAFHLLCLMVAPKDDFIIRHNSVGHPDCKWINLYVAFAMDELELLKDFK